MESKETNMLKWTAHSRQLEAVWFVGNLENTAVWLYGY